MDFISREGLSLALLILYVLVKDVTVPLVRRLNHKSSNPGTSTGELSHEFSSFRAEVRAQREEQLRVNERLEGNVHDLFRRLDADRKR